MKSGNIPYNVMMPKTNDWANVPRMPQAIVPVLATAFGITSAVGTFLLTAAVYIGVSAVTSWALQALAPKPKSGVQTQGLLTNIREAAAPHDYVYGQVRKGGVITYLEATGENNRYLHMVISLAGHELEEIGDIYINDEVVTIDEDLNVTSSPWNSKIRIEKFKGDQTTAPAALVSQSAHVDNNFIGRGIAYLYVRLDYDQDVFANGIPLFTAVVKGNKVFDPRTSGTAYSANAALCIRDYLTADYGMADVGSTDDTIFSAAANVCDEDVDLATAGVQPRYEMNGVVSAALAPGDILQSMMTSCAGTLFWGQGKWQLRPGYYTSPVKTFTLDDLRGPISLSTRTSRRDNFNIIRGTFNNADARWITQDYPEYKGNTFIAEDNGLENALDLELPLTTSPAMAQRLAKLTLFRGREQMTFSADFSMEAFDVQVGDIIALTNPRYGWTAKEFEVLGWRFFADGDAGDLRVNLALRETSEAAFSWTAEESAIISNNTTLLSYTEVPPVGLSAVARTQIIREKLTNIIALTVTSGNPAGVDFVEAQYKKTSDSAYITLGTGELGNFEAIDLEDDTYDFRARAVNAFGYRGEWEFLTGIEASGLLEPPQDVAGLFAEVNGTTTHLEWTPVLDLDLSFYRIRHAVETTNATWANATTALDKVSRPASFASLPTRPGTYMVRSYDKSGVASTNYTSVVVTSDVIPDYANTLTQTDSPTFSGTKTGCSVTSGELRITDTSTAPSEATYDLSTYIDTGSVRRAHVRVDANVNRFDSSSGLWDDLPGLFDGLPGLFDDFTGDAQFADTNLLFYVSTTPDDPAGTPTWSPYQQFRAGEFYGRAFRFRVVLKSSSVNVTPSISGLTALVEYN